MLHRMISNYTYTLLLCSLSSLACQMPSTKKQAFKEKSLKEMSFETTMYGMTPLHFAPWLLEILDLNKEENRKRLNELDTAKAFAAANLIKIGVSVNQQDHFQKTPFDYAAGMQKYLPKVYEVMKAGKVIQDVRKKLPQPDQNGVYNMMDLLAMRDTKPISESEMMEWHNAELTLTKYLSIK